MSTRVSPAIKLLRMVWDHEGHQRGHSWDRINHAMAEALSFAIKYGFAFNKGDFEAITRSPDNGGFSFRYWAGSNRHMVGERFYALAVEGNGRYGENMSAAQAFEAWAERKPFLIRRDQDVKTPRRVAIDSRFNWYGTPISVTSFSKNGQSFTACSYENDPVETCKTCSRYCGGGAVTVKRRHTITHDAIKEYHEALKVKEQDRIADEVLATAGPEKVKA